MAIISTGLPAPTPDRLPETEAFWEATLEGRFLLLKCLSCGRIAWQPRPVCAECTSTEFEWVESEGNGTVYSFTITRRGMGSYAEAGPFVLAVVELAEGPRMLTNIVECEEGRLAIGARVEIVFHPTEGAAALPRFKLA